MSSSSSVLFNYNPTWFSNGGVSRAFAIRTYNDKIIALDTSGNKIHIISKTQPGGTNNISYVTFPDFDANCIYMARPLADTLYITSRNTRKIYAVNLTNATLSDFYTFGAGINLSGILQIADDLYVSSYNENLIYKLNITTQTLTTFYSGLPTLCNDLVSDGTYIYTGSDENGSVYRINISTSVFDSNWGNTNYGSNRVNGLSVRSGFLYATLILSGSVIKISLADPTQFSDVVTGISYPYGVETDSNRLYVGDNSSIGSGYFSLPAPPCFHEDTLIETQFGQIPVSKLAKGMLVKTHQSGFKAVDMVGHKVIEHPADASSRDKAQLYVCSPAQYPTLTGDLILTGCHSILVDDFTSEEEKAAAVAVNGDVYVTEAKYRLPACVDARTTVHPEAGSYTIYHVALENADYYMNYGIYANGLLVESCSKRYLKELSGMELK